MGVEKPDNGSQKCNHGNQPRLPNVVQRLGVILTPVKKNKRSREYDIWNDDQVLRYGYSLGRFIWHFFPGCLE
ncbi:hypothetical protein TNCT_521661 [Trichonephila clavata]|uniref:Uncharacterized protein n=1 Tax=Trichonephila clavata TaxID=2740835 RepID=A0A8X6II93_TRICU|nr:hypothetical protein TNCT_521661 [Trichonephila clavata]